MVGRVLLDTSAVVALFRGNRALVDKLGRLEDVCTSVVVVGELKYGASHSASPGRNLERVNEFANSILVVPIDPQTADV